MNLCLAMVLATVLQTHILVVVHPAPEMPPITFQGKQL